MSKHACSKLFSAISALVVALFVLLSSVSVWAQAANTNDIKLQRQRLLDSTKASRAARADSIAAIRKYRESKRYQDSVEQIRNTKLNEIKNARKHIADSVTAIRKQKLDSTLQARTQYNDSIAKARLARTDSLAAIKKYKESKRYKDSLERRRNARLDSIQSVRKSFADSLTALRQQKLDSIKTIRTKYADSIKTVRATRTDSLARIRKYRESKRYQDSVSIIKQNRLDSIRIVRQKLNDSVRTERQRVIDSSVASRKAISEALTAQRKARADSIAAVRKIKTDSLAKKAEEKEKETLARAKEREKKSNLKFELKLKKKRQAWSNDKMLKRKWSLPRKVVQNTFTRYNYYFNAREKMREAERNMLRASVDNYDTLLPLFPFDPDRDSTKMLADMDSIIQKTSLGIQIHDPRTKWADDLYLLLGQAYYYKGDYNNAQAAFRYVISIRQQRIAAELKKNASKLTKEEKLEKATLVEEDKKGFLDFFKHQSAHNEAILWLARTLTEAQKPTEAESILDLIEIDRNSDEQMQARIALENAYLLLNEQDYRAAQVQLDSVVAEKTFPLWLRQRANYLAAQLNERSGNYKRAYDLFNDVISLNPNAEMEFYSAKNAAYNLLKSGGDASNAIASMKKLLKDGKFDKYNDQIYYVLGMLAKKSELSDDAIAYYNKSIASAKATKKQKAITYAALGDIYYTQSNYHMAKHAFDSAAFYSKHAADNEDVQRALKLAKVVDNVALPIEQIAQGDSLLALAALDQKGQLSAVRAHIKALRKAKEAASNNNTISIPEVSAGGSNTSRDWYFTSAASIQQGSNDFKRKFGNRPLVDDWRRLSAIGFNSNASNKGNSDTATEYMDEDGLPTEEALLAMIPKTEEEKNAIHKDLRRAYMYLASAYINDLQEYTKGEKALDKLNEKYPNHEYKDEEQYLRYTAQVQQNNYQQAQQHANILLQSYPTSRWAKLVQPKNETTEQTHIVPVVQYYDETYAMAMDRNYTEALNRSRNALSIYKQKDYQKRFRIVEGIALAGTGQYQEADTLMRQFIAQHKNDTLNNWAEAVLNYIGVKRSEDSLRRVQAQADSLSKVSTTTTSDSVQAAKVFLYQPTEEHFAAIGFTRSEPRMMAIVAGTKDYNMLKQSDKQLQTEFEIIKPGEGIMVVRRFKNHQAAAAYLNQLNQQQQTIFRDFKRSEYFTFTISEGNLALLKLSGDLAAYMEFYKKNYR